MNTDEFRHQFPAVKNSIYLNSAAIGPLSDSAKRAAIGAIEEQTERGSRFIDPYEETLARVRGKVAKLIGAKAKEIAFLRNTVEGLSTVASGFGWRPGDNIVASAIEFSGNAYPWLNMERHGVHCRFVPTPDGAVRVEDLIRATDDRTRLITVSLVQFSNGYRCDLKTLGAFCRSRNIRLMVDGIQGVGIVPLDVNDSAIDFLACGVQKWLCAPMGLGFLYVREEYLSELSLTEIGNGSVVPVQGTYRDYRLVLRPDARRFESGIMSYTSICGFDASLDLIDRVGVPVLHKHVTGLTTRLVEGLRERGYATCSPQNPRDGAGIVAFGIERWPSEEQESRFLAKGIIVALREQAIRVSCHGFNTAGEIDALLEALP
jgi:cysteine desulfurase / selenocysteine lyase